MFASGLRAIARYLKCLALQGVQQIKGPAARIEDAAWPLDTPAAWASLCASLRASTMQHDGTSSRAAGLRASADPPRLLLLIHLRLTNKHVEERSAMGIVPNPLDPGRTLALVNWLSALSPTRREVASPSFVNRY